MIAMVMMAALAGVPAPAVEAKPAMAPAPSPATDDHIPAKAIVEIEIAEAIHSKTSNIGDMFALRLAAPLIVDGRTILPAGLVGRGQVTHAAKPGWGGKAGELIVNARYVECGSLRIPLGHFHYGTNGKSNVGGAFVTSQFIPLGQFLVSGGEAVIPAGARGTAQVNAEVVVPAGAAGQCAPTAP